MILLLNTNIKTTRKIRAVAVGIDADRIQVEGHGESDLITDDEGIEDKEASRRMKMVILIFLQLLLSCNSQVVSDYSSDQESISEEKIFKRVVDSDSLVKYENRQDQINVSLYEGDSIQIDLGNNLVLVRKNYEAGYCIGSYLIIDSICAVKNESGTKKINGIVVEATDVDYHKFHYYQPQGTFFYYDSLGILLKTEKY